MALTNAERQRRYRARRKGALPPVKRVRSARPPSRAQRWRAAVATLLELQEYYSERLENAPVPLRDSPYGLKLQAIDELDFSNLEAIEVPLGYGND